MISDDELRAGVRRFAGATDLDVRVLARAPLRVAELGSGAHFERVALEIAGEPRALVLKEIAPDPVCVTRERRFYETLGRELSVRMPRAFGSGELEGRVDGWILLEELPRALRWRPEHVFALAREAARLHAATLGRAPEWLPRPFSRELAAALAFVPEGIERLQALQRREPLLRDLASPRTLELGRALARAPDALVAGLARSPECVVHRDLHPGNVWPLGEGEVLLFDWEAVSAGPPIFDLTLPMQYLAIRQLRVPFRASDVGFHRPGVPAWSEVERVYLDALERESGGAAPREAVASAADAAFAWEALYRLGWAASQLEGHVPRTSRRLARVPLVRALAGLGDRAALYAAWQAMFADLEERAARLLG